MDVRKYFDSIDHDILKGLLRRLLKDRQVLGLLDGIIDSYETAPSKGLPIGNLTSQYFANHYLAVLDHCAKERFRVGPFVRYMDDMLVFSDDAARLPAIYDAIGGFCEGTLHLSLKPPVIDTTRTGVPFLGFLLRRSGIYLTAKTKRRFAVKARSIGHDLGLGLIGEAEAGARITAMTAHLSLARSRSFRYHVFHGRVLRDEPRESRRELEQRRVERAFGQSEQQHSRQPEQQPWLPLGSSPSPAGAPRCLDGLRAADEPDGVHG